MFIILYLGYCSLIIKYCSRILYEDDYSRNFNCYILQLINLKELQLFIFVNINSDRAQFLVYLMLKKNKTYHTWVLDLI